jgi:Sec-independent protein translocase protein TatA
MGPIGGPEMAFIFFLALVLFGPKKPQETRPERLPSNLSG